MHRMILWLSFVWISQIAEIHGWGLLDWLQPDNTQENVTDATTTAGLFSTSDTEYQEQITSQTYSARRAVTAAYTMNACSPNACGPKQDCRVVRNNTYTCVCRSGLIGPTCGTKCRSYGLDLVFLLDSSSSITELTFAKMLDTVSQIINNLHVEDDSHRIGLITFASHATANIYLNSFVGSPQKLNDAIHNISFSNYQTNVSGAFRLLRTELLTNAHGARQGVPKAAILITDGGATVEVESTLAEAGLVKDNGTIVMALGIGDIIQDGALAALVSPAVCKHLFIGFDKLYDLIVRIQNTSCSNTRQIDVSNGTCNITASSDDPWPTLFGTVKPEEVDPEQATATGSFSPLPPADDASSTTRDIVLPTYKLINECQTSNGGCEQLCIDLSPRYECACWRGYSLSENLHNCVDIDECTEVDCGSRRQCYNTQGTYICFPKRWIIGYNHTDADAQIVSEYEVPDHLLLAMLAWLIVVSILLIVLIVLCIITINRRSSLRPARPAAVAPLWTSYDTTGTRRGSYDVTTANWMTTGRPPLGPNAEGLFTGGLKTLEGSVYRPTPTTE